MPQVFWFLLSPALLVIFHLVAAASDSPMPLSSPTSALPGCPSMCGDIEIPYPFGISKECSWPGPGYFTLTCNHSFNPPRAFMLDAEVTSISLVNGSMTIFTLPSSLCYTSSNTATPDGGFGWNLVPPFQISERENAFTVIGCNSLALMYGKEDYSYFTGCVTSCSSLDKSDLPQDGDKCLGLGCCQTPILSNLTSLFYGKYTNGTVYINPWWRDVPCVYSFVAQKDWYKFNRSDLISTGPNDTFDRRVGERTMPLVLDWAIRGAGTCQLPPKADGDVKSVKPKAPACVNLHSYCVNATHGPGYLCNCTDGYKGNPYITGPGGCTNINECLRPDVFPCHGECKDTDGSYECKCPPGYQSDGDPKEKPCNAKLPRSAKLAIGITIGTSVLFFIILGIGVCYMLKRIEQKAKERELKAIEKKNGSERLQNVKTLILFTKEELDQITKNNLVPLGKGGFGKVHKGTLSDMTDVAVKASHVVTEATLDEFVKEVEIQSRMMHKNILKLLGCCLRVDVPLLVYEYAAKGSLEEILHGKNNDQQREPLTLRSRLDIAIGCAQGLAYMHSYTENGIQHADVKPANILLDGGLVPKISDFGLSKAFIPGKDFTMHVTGCLAYMDPVYMETGMLTPKSDVYSFGIVLLELICRKPVGYGENTLVNQFKRVYEKDNTGKVLFDKDIAQEEEDIPILDEIGILAMKCLKENVDERPAMVSVASALVMLDASWDKK